MARQITPPTADDVRAWGRARGFQVADRGRLSHELIAAYNKGRKHTFVQTHAPVAQPITVVVGSKADKRGREKPVTETVTAGPIRAWAKANGVELGQRGRIPASVVEAYGAAVAKAAAAEAKKAERKAARAAAKAAKAAAELVTADA